MNYEQKYPYFTVTHVSAGQLVKLINNKFDTYHDAIKFIDKMFKNRADAFNSEQIVILEYDSPYNSSIHTIFNFGESVSLKKYKNI